MFSPEFLEKLEKQEQEKLKTSYGRYQHRVEKWRFSVPFKPVRWGKYKGYKQVRTFDLFVARATHHFWWLVHNCIAHPMIGFAPIKSTFRFHDYTSDKINLKNEK